MNENTRNCEEVRRRLRDRFDQGMPPESGLGEHLTACARCAEYAERLRSLENMFAELPMPRPSPGFARRVRERMRSQPTRAGVRWAGAVLAAACIAALALGWYFPVGGYLDVARAWAAAWALDTVAPLTGTAGYLRDTAYAVWREGVAIEPPDLWAALAWLEEVAASWRQLAQAYLPNAPASALWGGLAAGILFIVGFNGFQLTAVRSRGRV